MTLKKNSDGHLVHFSIRDMQDSLLNWYSLNKASHPWRLHWQMNRNPYPVWVSEIMLQQTTLAAMIPIYEKFIMRFPSLRSLALAKEDEIKKTVQGLGYYRRFSLLHKGAQKIVGESQHIEWPKSYEEWLKVPGVGDYTAAALSSITLNEVVPVLDGNVIRVLCRLFDIRKPSNDGPLKKDLKFISAKLISHAVPGDFNQGLMELGQKICRPLNASCDSCPVQKCCLAYKNQSVHLAPQAKLRKETEKVKLRLHILEKGESFGIVKRPAASKFLRGTSGFLTELFDGDAYRVDGDSKRKTEVPKGVYLGTVSHNITHHSIRAEVYVLRSKTFNAEWLERSKLVSQLVSSLDMKAWGLLQKKQKDIFS